MKSFLSRLTNGEKPPQVAPVGARPVPQARVSKGLSTARVLPMPQRPTPKPNAAPPIYKSMSDLPKYVSLASAAGGAFELTGSQRQHMFILELAEPPRTFAVVTTREHFGAASYKAALQRIQEAGGRSAACGIADGGLITTVNKDQRDASQNDERDKPIVRDILKLVQSALAEGASDIHIECRATEAMVRIRVNGRLKKYSDSWEPEYIMRLARSLHTIADDDSKPTTFSEDCQMSVSVTLPSGARVKLRVQVSPAYPDAGLDIVIRVLRVAASAKVRSLEELGYAPDHIQMLEYMRASPHGLIVIAGTTGSGKSTTLQTVMQNIRRANADRKLISIEDPPEYVLEGVTQIPVARRNEKGLNPFTAAMRNTMRMDPDVIMVGEIRDAESAELMVGMVQSGHKALTTIHTESAIGIVSRLRRMGVENDVLAGRGFISGLVFQTLVPTLCKHCRLDYVAGMEEVPEALHERIRHVTRPGDTLFVESAAGCKHCDHTGISGRTVCAEIVVPDNAMRDFIMTNDMKGAHDHWRGKREGKPADSMMGATAMDHAILKMRRGEVSPISVEGALGLLYDFTQEVSLSGETGDLLGLK